MENTLTRAQVERMVGGRINIRLILPTAYGRPPLWEAEMPAWPSVEPVQFRAYDSGTEIGLLIEAAKALHKWQAANIID